jgi:hypothetical protein
MKVWISKSKFGRGLWNLHGGSIKRNKGINQVANRILKERTSLEHMANKLNGVNFNLSVLTVISISPSVQIFNE